MGREGITDTLQRLYRHLDPRSRKQGWRRDNLCSEAQAVSHSYTSAYQYHQHLLITPQHVRLTFVPTSR